MVTKSNAKSTAPVSRFAKVEGGLAKSNRVGGGRPPAALDQEILDILKESKASGDAYAVAIDDTPATTVKGVVSRNAKTAEGFLRRHAVSLGYGLKVRVVDGGERLQFAATDKKVVPTGADRKPRTKRVAQ